MFEYRKNNAVQSGPADAFSAARQFSQRSLHLSARHRCGVLAVVVAAVLGGCAQIPHGSMFSDDQQQQRQSALQPSLFISKDIDLIRVSGIVGSNVEAAMIRLRLASIYGAEMLIDGLKVDESIVGAEWFSAVLDTAEGMRDVEKFALTAENGQLTLDGNVQSQASADALAKYAASKLGQQLIVSNEIDYPGREANVLAQDATGEDTSREAITTATLLPLEGDTISSSQQQTVTDQQLTAQSIPSPAVSGTIPLPVTNSAVVLEQRSTASDGADLFVPPANDSIAGSVSAANDSDGDGIENSIDECNSRPGYPVDATGCQALDGMLKNVRFQGDGSKLTREAMGSLNNVARVMNEYPAARIAILSYTSDSGSALETRGQARDRARSVVGYLINKGVESTRLEAYAFGHINNSDDHIMIKEVD